LYHRLSLSLHFDTLSAPVTATNVGMTPQTIDSPKLQTLMDKLNSLQMAEGNESPPPLEELVKELAEHSTWRFEEQVRRDE